MGKKLRIMLTAMLVVIAMVFTCMPATAATPLKITKQPVSVTVSSGTTAKVDVDATGEGLTYKWYYKNKGDKKFSLTTSFKGDTYSVKMNAERAGRQVYCVISDKSGDSVKSNTATLSKGTTLKVSTQPKSVTVAKGKTAKVSFTAKGDGLKYKWYYKNLEATKFSRTTTFKGTYYSVKMNGDRDGRQVYCVITDKYGSSIKTKTVTLSQKATVKITKQPASVAAEHGSVAKTTLSVSGSGVNYTWYYKNAGSSTFKKTSTFKKNYYSVEMNADRDGRQVYCLVVDKYGKKVKSKVATLSLKHTWDSGVVTKEPACKTEGEKLLTCTVCGETTTAAVAPSHKLGDWEVIKEATAEEEGFERSSCSECSYYDDRVISKLPVVNNITVVVEDNDSYKVGVGSNGKYTLKDPEKIGYKFVGWKDENGNEFASSGTVDSDIKVYATWEIDGTDTLKELIERTKAGVEEIIITDDIIIDQPIYISYKTNIYSDGDYTLKRDPGYKGDFFVVGEDKSGFLAAITNKGAELNLGNGQGILTIDGNRDNTTVTVNGALVFASDSATVNIYDGVRLVNNEKLENSRIFEHQDLIGETVSLRAGGAAIINLNSTVNMYGGVIENNAVYTEHTIVKDENNVESKKDYSGCGGAVYNNGNFNMYGGTISDNKALRGGGVYNYRLVFLNAGTISDNESITYGGGISSSSSSNAETYIGRDGTSETMLIKGNVSGSYGAAVYSNLWSPIVVYESAVFEANETPSSGGAIYTAGPLTINGAEFINNVCEGSGGAIYHTYNNAEFSRRYLDVSNTVFKGNEASLGGAVTLSSSVDTGTSADFLNCEFIENKAVKGTSQPGNGGAIYVTRKSDADIKGCTFEGNTAFNNAGAVAIQSGSKVNLTDTDFIGNSANSGGAVYTSTGTNVNMDTVLFDGNNAVLSESGSGGNGGALHITDVSIKTNNVDFKNNSAATHGGAVYNKSCELKVDATCEFEGNTAGSHGGAVYLTYTELADKTKDPSKLIASNTVFKNNAGKSGGAVSIRSACEANVTGAQFVGNEATGNDKDSLGGGAVYVGYGKLSMTDVKAEGNISAKNGGAVSITDSPVTVNGGSFDKNEGTSGGAVYVNNGANYTVVVNNTTFNENKADTAGGIYTTSKGTVELKNIDFSKNHANGNAGALYVSQTPITLTDVDFYENHADNNAGALYAAGKELTFDSTYEFKGNSAGGHGGAIYLTYKDGGEAGKIGSVLNANGMIFEGNTAKAGGAISLRTDCVVNMKGGQLLNNKATGTERDASGGGAIYAGYGSLTMENVTATGNDCDGYGGVVNAAGSDVTVTGGELNDNQAASGGAIAAYNKSDVVVNNAALNRNTSDYANSEYDNKKGGGAVNVDGSTLDISKTTFDSNEAGYYGGTLLAVKSTVTIDEETAFTNSKGRTGAALSLVSSNTTIENSTFTGNEASSNGVIYAGSGTLDITSVVAQDNKAGSGGVIYASGTSGKVTLKNSTWSKNTAKNGGTLYIKEAQVEATNFEFSNNTANLGGAVYNECGTFTISNVAFIENSAEKNSSGSAGNGGAVDLVGGTLNATADNITFKNNTAGNHAGAVYVAYKTNDDGSKTGGVLNAENVVFENNYAAVGGGAVSIRTDSTANITGGILKNNSTEGTERVGEGGGAVYEGYGSLTMTNVAVTDNTSTGFGGAVNAAGGTVDIIGGTFTGNVAGSGGVIGGAASAKITVSDVAMTGNESNYVNSDYDNTKGGGAVNVTDSKLTLSKVTLDGNKSNYYGGSLLAVASTVTIDGETEVKNSIGATGGALYFTKSSKVTIADTSVTNNTSNGNGAIYINGGSLDATNVTATGNTSTNGGVLYASGSSTKVTVENSKWNGNTSNSNGGAMVIANASVTASNVEFKNNTAKLGGAVYAEKGTLETKNVTFEENSAIKNSSGSAGNGGAVSLAGGTLVVTGENSFKNNDAANHGGAVYVSYYTPKDSTTKTPGVLNANGGTFEGNTAVFGGAISARTSCETTLTGAVLKSNTATTSTTEGGGAIYANTNTLVLSGTTITENTSKYYGGAVYVTDADVTINNNTQITKNTSDKGRTLYFTNGCNVTVDGATVADHATGGDSAIYIKDGTFDATGLDVTSNSATSGGAMYISGSSTEVSLKGGTWTENSAAHQGGAIYLTSGKLSVSGTAFKENSAVLGGAVYTWKGTIETADATYEGNSAVLSAEGDGGNGGAITVVGGKVTGTGNNIFKNNTAAGYAGAIYVSYATDADGETKIPGVLDMTGGYFEGNTAVAGGAIASRTDCQATLNGTELKANIATGAKSDQGGGAIFTNNNSLTLSGVIMDGNSSPYYGGAVTALGAELTVNNNSQIKNNVGVTGSAFNMREKGTNIFDTVSLTDNVATSGSGVMYITGNGTLDITNMTASGNKNNNGGVLYVSGSAKLSVTDSDFTGNTAVTKGGAIDHRSSSEATIKNTTISDNSAKVGAGIATTGKLTLDKVTLTGNAATETGGGLYISGASAKVTVTNESTVKSNTAATGGGAYVDAGATLEVNGSSVFDGNTAIGGKTSDGKTITGDGGAILLADSSEEGTAASSLVLSSAVLQNNKAAAKGGAVSTDTASPNLLINAANTTFSGNEAQGAGGGAVEIQNGNCASATDPTELKLVFTNCTFTGNKSKTTGAAIEIRTSSCAKVDGIVATGNKAGGNGGVFYVTSNHSRLYLTGTVDVSENTAGSGTFAFLYDNKYSNPPKIYTTHDNTAAWYTDVKGNPQNVVFNATML